MGAVSVGGGPADTERELAAVLEEFRAVILSHYFDKDADEDDGQDDEDDAEE